MAGRVGFTADLHLGHEWAAEIRGFRSVKDHNETIIHNIATDFPSTRDVVWILGDIAFGKEYIKLLSEIPAIKKLVLGNHDHYHISFFQAVADQVYGAYQHKTGVLLTHIPVELTQKNRFTLNAHGHTHERVLSDPWYFNCCLDQNNMRPFKVEQLYERMKAIGRWEYG